MHRNNPFFGLLVALILACCDQAHAKGQAQQPGTDQHIAASARNIAAVSSDQAGLAPNQEAVTVPCQPGDDRRDSDLCAQWKAADAAADSAWWAWVAAVSGIIGTVAVLAAIGLAYQANSIARNTAKQELRAYVLPLGADIYDVELDKAPYVKVAFSNSGATLAHEVDLDLWFELFPIDVEERFLVPQPVEGKSRGPIAPNGQFVGHVHLPRFLNADLLQAYEEGSAQFIAYGVIRYRDCFQIRHETNFRFYCRADKPGLDGGPSLLGADKGNNAT